MPLPMLIGTGRSQLGSAAWSPDSLPNLALWLDPGQSYADAALTISVTADNTEILGIKDRSVNARHATGTTPNGLVLETGADGINGHPAWSSGVSKRMVTPSFLDSSFYSAMTVYAVTTSANTALKVFAGTSSNTLYFGEQDASSHGLDFSVSGLTPAHLYGVVYTYLRGRVHAFQLGPSAILGSTNGEIQSASTTGTPTFTGALTIGNTASGAFEWPGLIGDVLVYKAVHDLATRNQVLRYLMGKYSIAPLKLMGDGNSIIVGQGIASPTTNNFFAVAQARLSGSWEGDNYGVGGQTTQQMTADAVAQIDWQSSSLHTKNILVMLEIRNDMIVNGIDAATAYANLVTYCQARQAAGWTVVAGTCLPSGASLGPTYDAGTFETARLAVNASMRANQATFCNAIADFGAHAIMGDAANLTDVTYYLDQIHPTIAGHALLADVLEAALLTL